MTGYDSHLRRIVVGFAGCFVAQRLCLTPPAKEDNVAQTSNREKDKTMPEFAEVNLQVQYLQERCAGWKIKEFGYEGWSHFQNLPEEGRDESLHSFFRDNELEAFTQRGKHVIIRTRNGSMLSHLMFKGRWSVEGEPFLSNYKHHKRKPTEKSNNFWMIADNGGRLNFHEPEYKGKVTVYPGQTPGELDKLTTLGPEIIVTPMTDPDFATAWTLDDLRGRASRSKQAIKAFLLDQKKQAGLGNMYVCESLYLAGIAPSRPANSLSEQELSSLHTHCQEILQKAIDNQLDYDVLLQIYKKDTDPSGNPVNTTKISGRDTFWVPAVQS